MKTASPRQRLSDLSVAAVMHVGVLTCDRETPLTDVARTMARQSVHCIVVENGSGDELPWGVVSDLDLVAAAMVRGLDEQTAGGSAASPIVLVRPDETLERAVQLMTAYGSAHLLVVDTTGPHPVGVLSTLDIAAALSEGEET